MEFLVEEILSFGRGRCALDGCTLCLERCTLIWREKLFENNKDGFGLDFCDNMREISQKKAISWKDGILIIII